MSTLNRFASSPNTPNAPSPCGRLLHEPWSGAMYVREPGFKEQSMAEDFSNRGPQDRAKINVTEDHEVQYWTDALGVTEETLRIAVAAAGTSAQNVRDHLGLK